MIATERKTTADLLRDIDGLFSEIPDDGELSLDWQSRLDDWVDGVENKADGLRLAHSKVNHEMDFIEMEVERLRKRFESLKKSKDQIKFLAAQLLEAHQQATGDTKIKGSLGTVYFQSTTRVNVTVAPEDLPKAYQRIQSPQVQPDKEKIKKALESGQSVIGAELLVNQGVRFR